MHRLSSAAALLLLVAAGCGSSRPSTGSEAGCASCHGFPPATLTAGGDHPQPASGAWVATDCAACHATSVDGATGDVIPVSSGGTHADGKIDGRHPLPYPPSVHGPAANLGLAACTPCHGPNLDGVGGTTTRSCDECHTGGTAAWRTNCTFCHGTFNAAYGAANLPEAAPPQDVAGATDVTDVTVGVHQAHVTAASPILCEQCHSASGATPADVFTAGHIDPAPAEVPFGALARTRGRTPVWDRATATCAATWCHGQGGALATPNWTVAGALGCGSCHPASPTTDAHTAHLAGSTLSNGFPCASCHAIPASTSHLDGIVAVAFTNAVVPGGTFDAGTCSAVYCHGNFTGGDTANAPSWTGAAACGSCHGISPATGRHQVPQHGVGCNLCHGASYSTTTVNKTLHVNGAKDVSAAAIVGWNGANQTCMTACHTPPDEVRTWYP